MEKAASCYICPSQTTEITKCLLGSVVSCAGQKNVEKTGPEASVKVRCSSSGDLWPHKDLSGAALGAVTYSREDVG